jgi:ubiquinone/menaquinone biosynthesis C-methylase UbiE
MKKYVCPWYFGYFLANPLRKLFQNPDTILRPYIEEGMKVLEIGPGMGFFSLPAARLAGSRGKIFCIDVQEKMLSALNRRARKTGLSDKIQTRTCSEKSLLIDDLQGTIDLAFAFAVIHEVQDEDNIIREIFASLKPGGIFILAEPAGHISKETFDATLARALLAGFRVVAYPRIRQSRSVVMKK